MELKRYLLVLLRGWWLILPSILVAVSAALVITYSQTPIYRTAATFVVSPSSAFGDVNEVIRGLDTLTKRDAILATYAHIAASDTIVKQVYRELNLTAEQKKYLNVTSELIPPTNIIKVIVESDDPELAQTCANLVGQKTIEYIQALDEVYDMKPLDAAYKPRHPSKPDTTQNLLLSVILGTVVGVGLAFLREYLSSTGQSIAGETIIDGETGIYNRHYFLQRLSEELSRARRHHYPLAIALLTVGRLDMMPDMRLPRLRNEAIRRVALFLKQYLREEDLVARFEGDTLALLFPYTSGVDAEKLVQKLHTRIEWNVFDLEEAGLKLNLSAVSGVCACNGDHTSRDVLIARAKRALQKADGEGYGTVYLFGEEMDLLP